MDLLIRFIIWVLKTAYESIQEGRKADELRKEGLNPSIASEHPGASAQQIRQGLATQAQRQLQAWEALVRDAERAQDQVVALQRDLGSVAGGRVLLRVVEEQVKPVLDADLPEARALPGRVRAVPPHQAALLLRDGKLEPLQRRLREAVVRAAVLSVLRDTRANTDEAHRLADADAISDALLDPIQQFALDHGLGLPRELPISAPATPNGEAIWIGLLPKRYPILFVPADFLADLYRYAAVPHELGHLLWRDMPGLAREVHAASGFQIQKGLLGVSNGRLTGTLDQLFTPWMSEIFADFAAVLLLGPAAARGMIHSFAAPKTPLEVVTAQARGNAYDEHPPAHLRMLWVCHLLWTMGFDQQAKVLLAEWNALHGELDRVRLPLEGGGLAQFPVEALAEPGRELIGRLYEHQFVALAGFRMADVPGFEMAPGLWARVLRRAEALSNEVAFNDDGRVVLAAAIEARAKHPARALVITLGLRRAILGRDSDDRRVADAHYQRSGATNTPWAEELRAAMILRQALQRPGSRRRL